MRRILPLLAALSISGCNCGPNSNSLDGSAGDTYDLAFDKVRVIKAQGGVWVIAYEKGSADTIVKVTLNTQALPADQQNIKGGVAIDLRPNPIDVPRVTVSRAVANDQRHNLPPVDRGSMTFNSIGSKAGDTTNGSFFITFGQGGDGGAGTTLNGKFSAPLEVQ
jgi:hypothetical protein